MAVFEFNTDNYPDNKGGAQQTNTSKDQTFVSFLNRLRVVVIAISTVSVALLVVYLVLSLIFWLF